MSYWALLVQTQGAFEGNFWLILVFIGFMIFLLDLLSSSGGGTGNSSHLPDTEIEVKSSSQSGNIGSAIFWMAFLSVLLFWLPALGPLIAGYVGGKKSGGVLRALIAALLPIGIISGIIFFGSTILFDIPVIGAVMGGASFLILGIHNFGLVVGAIIGGALAPSMTQPTQSSSPDAQTVDSIEDEAASTAVTLISREAIECPRCGYDGNSTGANYCSACGEELPSIDCLVCGESTHENHAYCPNCGEKLRESKRASYGGEEESDAENKEAQSHQTVKNHQETQTKETGPRLEESEKSVATGDVRGNSATANYDKKQVSRWGKIITVCGGCRAQVEEEAETCPRCKANLSGSNY